MPFVSVARQLQVVDLVFDSRENMNIEDTMRIPGSTVKIS